MLGALEFFAIARTSAPWRALMLGALVFFAVAARARTRPRVLLVATTRGPMLGVSTFFAVATRTSTPMLGVFVLFAIAVRALVPAGFGVARLCGPCYDCCSIVAACLS